LDVGERTQPLRQSSHSDENLTSKKLAPILQPAAVRSNPTAFSNRE
jgi:hypothetical protein